MEKKKNSTPLEGPNGTTPRPNKYTIHESNVIESELQSTSNSKQAMGSSTKKSHPTKNPQWIQKTLNPQRNTTQTTGDNIKTTPDTPLATDRESEIRQQNDQKRSDDGNHMGSKTIIETDKKKLTEATSNNTDGSATPPSTTEEKNRAETEENSHSDEELGYDLGSATAVYDLPYFVERLPIELLTAYENAKFTKEDLNYALSLGRESVGNSGFNEFIACGSFEAYLIDVLQHDNTISNSSFCPPALPSRTTNTSKSPFRPTAARKTAPSTPSNASTSESSDLRSECNSQYSDTTNSGLTPAQIEEKREYKRAAQQRY